MATSCSWLSTENSDSVHINGFGTPWWVDDIAGLAASPVGGVMLVMVESVDHVTETAKLLSNVPIVALVADGPGFLAAHHRHRGRQWHFSVCFRH